MARYKYQPGGLLLQWVAILMVVHIVVLVIGSVSTAMEISLIGRLTSGENVSQAEINGNDMRQGLIGILQVALYIGLAVVFLRSISRANRNARALGAKGMEFTPGWCIGWFFIPIMNLFKPFKAVQEIWRASATGSGRWENKPVPAIVGTWWALWIISAIAGQAVFRLGMNAESADTILMSSWVTLFSDLIDIPLAIVALLMIRGLYELQSEKRKERRRLKRESAAGGASAVFEPNCPACGEALESPTSTCPMCGHELARARAGGEW